MLAARGETPGARQALQDVMNGRIERFETHVDRTRRPSLIKSGDKSMRVAHQFQRVQQAQRDSLGRRLARQGKRRAIRAEIDQEAGRRVGDAKISADAHLARPPSEVALHEQALALRHLIGRASANIRIRR